MERLRGKAESNRHKWSGQEPKHRHMQLHSGPAMYPPFPLTADSQPPNSCIHTRTPCFQLTCFFVFVFRRSHTAEERCKSNDLRVWPDWDQSETLKRPCAK